MKQKLFTLFIALVFCIGTIYAESGTCGDNLTWDLTDDVLTISGTGDMWNYALVHFAPWYTYHSSIKSIIINDGVTSIGDYAFAYCTSLTSINIPSCVISIGNGVFNNCTGLTSITIPDSVTSIGGSAFSGSSGLTSITIGKSVTSIGDQAFYNCSNLVSVYFKGRVTNIKGDYIFYNCSNLANIYAACGDLERLTQVLNDIRVKYAPLPYTISTVAKNGYVSLPQNECEPLELEAIPDKGYHFVKWSDGNTDNPRTIVLKQDTTFVAEFAIYTYALNVSCDAEEGSIIGESGIFNYLSEHTFEAVANYGYTFNRWSDGVTQNPRTIVLTSDSTITALYELGVNTDFTINFNTKNGDEILSNSIVLKVPIAPKIEGFTFVGWQPVAAIIESNTIEIEAVYKADEPSSAPAVVTNPSNPAQKLIRNGNVYILHGEKVYTLQGQEVK